MHAGEAYTAGAAGVTEGMLVKWGRRAVRGNQDVVCARIVSAAPRFVGESRSGEISPSVLVSLSPRAIILGMDERGPHISGTRWELWISEGVRRLTET